LGKRSLPYTSWLVHELTRYLERDPGVPQLAAAVEKSAGLLARQLSPSGSPTYEYDSLVVVRIPDPMCVLCYRIDAEGCADYCYRLCTSVPGVPPCWCMKDPVKDCPYIDTLVNVTYFDEEDRAYDVRGWTSELPSTAFVLSATGRLDAKWRALSFLLSLQNSDGSFPDKWGFVPHPNQRMWVFASNSHSVIRTSCVFFYLSEILEARNVDARRDVELPYERTQAKVASETADSRNVGALPPVSENPPAASANIEFSSAAATTPSISVRPSPSFGNVFVQLSVGDSPSEVVVLSAGGRLVRRLASRWSGSGQVLWDGRREDGSPAAPGVYFVTVRGHSREVSAKIVLLRSE
jgi:hypothetical protein